MIKRTLRDFHPRWILVSLAVVLLAGVVFYQSRVHTRGAQVGFPSDDGWLRATWAQKLVHLKQADCPSVSPLWTILLAVGAPLGENLPIWAHFLGIVFLALTALYVYKLALRLMEGKKVFSLVCALLTVVEFRLLWSSQSGLEITLFTFLSLATIYTYLDHRENPRTATILCGVSLLTRPEGLLLFAALWLDQFIRYIRQREGRSTHNGYSLRRLGGLTLLFGAFLAPYLLFNLVTSGQLFGSLTATSAVEGHLSLGNYLLSVFLFFSQYHLAVLFSFFLLFLIAFVMRMDKSDSFAPVIWILLFIGAYALIRPSASAHGNYLLPLLPLIILYGVYLLMRLANYSLKQATALVGIYCLLIFIFGLLRFYPKGAYLLSLTPVAFIYMLLLCKNLVERPNVQQRWQTVIHFVAVLLILGTLLGFGFYAQQTATAYASDVRGLEQRQIALARWVDSNTPADAVIATDSPGALGFFAHRRMVGAEAFLASPSDASQRAEQSVTRMRQLKVDYSLPFTQPAIKFAREARLRPAYTSGHEGGCGGVRDIAYTLQTMPKPDSKVPAKSGGSSGCGSKSGGSSGCGCGAKANSPR